MKRSTLAGLSIAFCLCVGAAIAQEGYIQLPPDSTGKKLRMFQQTISSQTVYAQGYFLTNTAGSEIGLATSPLFVRFTDGAAAYDAAKESTLAGIKTGTDRIPSSPATDRTTAAAPFSMRLSDGSSFIDPRDVSDRSGRQLGAIANAGFNVNNLPSTYPNQQSNKTADYDSGAGTDTVTMYGLALPKSGGAVAGGTSTDPVRTDPTGTTPQPVTVSSLPLPTGAATETTLAGIKTGTDKIPASPATDRTTAAAPAAVRLSDGGAFYKPTTPSDTQPVSASSLPLPTGASTDASLTNGNQKAIARGGAKGSTTAADVTSENVDANTQALHVFLKNVSIAVTGTFWQATQPVSIAATIATNLQQLNGTTVDTNSGSKSAGTQRVVLATDQPTMTNAQPTTNANIDVALSTRTKPADQQHTIVDSNSTDFATGAKQDTGNTSLGTIVTNTTGASTAARQDTGNSSLSSMDAKTPALVNSAQPVIVMQLPAAPPVLTAAQLSNPLLYRAAMQQYCQKNLCPGR